MTNFMAGFDVADEREPDPETPGICGISGLKRSEGGWSVIGLRFYTQTAWRRRRSNEFVSALVKKRKQ